MFLGEWRTVRINYKLLQDFAGSIGPAAFTQNVRYAMISIVLNAAGLPVLTDTGVGRPTITTLRVTDTIIRRQGVSVGRLQHPLPNIQYYFLRKYWANESCSRMPQHNVDQPHLLTRSGVRFSTRLTQRLFDGSAVATVTGAWGSSTVTRRTLRRCALLLHAFAHNSVIYGTPIRLSQLAQALSLSPRISPSHCWNGGGQNRWTKIRNVGLR